MLKEEHYSIKKTRSKRIQHGYIMFFFDTKSPFTYVLSISLALKQLFNLPFLVILFIRESNIIIVSISVDVYISFKSFVTSS